MRSRISDAELAWAAGFFDGEGHIAYRKRRLMMAVAQTNREPLERFLDAVGGGRIYGPYSKGQQVKQVWHWQATGANVIPLMEKLLPYLCSIKATAYREALAAYVLAREQPRRRRTCGLLEQMFDKPFASLTDEERKEYKRVYAREWRRR
jgi:hypothetical protein